MARESAVVVGAGSISKAWFPPLTAERVDVRAVVDLKIEAARRQVEQFELDCPASTDLRATLKRARPDFVVDLTVPEAHCDVTCTALRAGCHVIGEKPMAASMDQALRMVRTAEQTDRTYMVSQSRRWEPHHAAVRRAVADGLAGRLTTLNCDFYIGAHFGGFRAEMESPLVLDMAIHHFDLARMFSGADPVAVYAHEFNPPGSWYAGDAAASCIFEMTGGVVLTYRGSWCAEGCPTSWNGDWRIEGPGGSISWTDNRIHYAHLHRTDEPKDEDVELLDVPPGGQAILDEFLSSIESDRDPECCAEDNIKSLAMTLAAIKSAREGRKVEMDELG